MSRLAQRLSSNPPGRHEMFGQHCPETWASMISRTGISSRDRRRRLSEGEPESPPTFSRNQPITAGSRPRAGLAHPRSCPPGTAEQRSAANRRRRDQRHLACGRIRLCRVACHPRAVPGGSQQFLALRDSSCSGLALHSAWPRRDCHHWRHSLGPPRWKATARPEGRLQCGKSRDICRDGRAGRRVGTLRRRRAAHLAVDDHGGRSRVSGQLCPDRTGRHADRRIPWLAEEFRAVVVRARGQRDQYNHRSHCRHHSGQGHLRRPALGGSRFPALHRVPSDHLGA